MTEVFEMDLWQLFCYIDGHNERVVQTQIRNVELAVLTGQYTGQYFTGKKAPDPNKIIKEIVGSLSNNIEIEQSAEEKIKEFKKQLKYFK